MTTSHRAQLEARSGAKSAAYVPTGTQHARLLPGHTKLKYRGSKQKGPVQPTESEAEDDQGSADRGIVGLEVANIVGEGEVVGDDLEEEGFTDGLEEEGSDEDQEALLQELNKIRQERMVARLRKEQDEEVDGSNRNISHVLPVAQAKAGWRSNTTFGRNRASRMPSNQSEGVVKGSKGFSNDLSKSEYHQDFLRRFIK